MRAKSSFTFSQPRYCAVQHDTGVLRSAASIIHRPDSECGVGGPRLPQSGQRLIRLRLRQDVIAPAPLQVAVRQAPCFDQEKTLRRDPFLGFHHDGLGVRRDPEQRFPHNELILGPAAFALPLSNRLPDDVGGR